jgi:PHD/YefM family antitoxin component YafN of YafNO toxin-antitoxin module
MHIDTARCEVVFVEKQGRSMAVILSLEEYQKLNDIKDALWVLKAESAKAEGYLSEEESEKLLSDLLNA